MHQKQGSSLLLRNPPRTRKTPTPAKPIQKHTLTCWGKIARFSSPILHVTKRFYLWAVFPNRNACSKVLNPGCWMYRYLHQEDTDAQDGAQLFRKSTHLLTKDSKAWKQYSLSSSSSTLQYWTIRGIIFSRCSPGKGKVSSSEKSFQPSLIRAANAQPSAASLTCLAERSSPGPPGAEASSPPKTSFAGILSRRPLLPVFSPWLAFQSWKELWLERT